MRKKKRLKNHHRTFFISLSVVILFSVIFFLYPSNPSLSFYPARISEGDPFIVYINHADISSIKKVTFDQATSSVFMYKHTLTALFGVDLNTKPGVYAVTVEMTNGEILTKNITIEKRQKITRALGIPQKLGGNTTQSDTQMVNNLIAENKTLVHLTTASTTLWTTAFLPPLKNIIVTDPYGYSRQTGVYSIPHKGVDYHASIGTPVLAINSGIVRLVANYPDYGKTIVIDHGLGVMSFYLHLSTINVHVGEVVSQKQIIGLTGQTGYALGPHLHLSIRINGISIDPVKFFALFTK